MAISELVNLNLICYFDFFNETKITNSPSGTHVTDIGSDVMIKKNLNFTAPTIAGNKKVTRTTIRCRSCLAFHRPKASIQMINIPKMIDIPFY